MPQLQYGRQDRCYLQLSPLGWQASIVIVVDDTMMLDSIVVYSCLSTNLFAMAVLNLCSSTNIDVVLFVKGILCSSD